MDLSKEWQRTGEHEDLSLSGMLDMSLIAKLPSRDPLQKIKNAVLINACWAALIGCGYLFVAFRFPFWQIIVCAGVLNLMTIAGILQNISLYRRLAHPVAGNALLQEMESHYDKIKKWMRIQERGGLLMFPICIAGGFMLGWYLGSGKAIGEFIRKPSIVVTLVVMLVILVPVCYRLAKWMSEKAFGQYARQLKENIDTLKNEA